MDRPATPQQAHVPRPRRVFSPQPGFLDSWPEPFLRSDLSRTRGPTHPNGDAAEAASRQLTTLCWRRQATAHATKSPIPEERTGKELHIGPSSLLRLGFKDRAQPRVSAARTNAHKCARTDDSQIGVRKEV